ncbi:MAG TPA: anti-sigma factor antagonist [Candidatus Dormibacteraeota bacterium]|nr:anti-sigma factor antagonist [Candidatus Dormibacteraeota bacterium]
MDETFDISEETRDGVSIVRAAGEIDIATAPALRGELEASIGRRPDVVVVDLLGVTFMDSTALGVLVGALKGCREAGCSMRIVVSDARVLKVFEITGLTDLFSIFSTLDEAVQG